MLTNFGHQTLEPAKREAEEILQKAQKEAEEIIQAGRAQAEKLIANGRQTVEHEKKVFQSATAQAFKADIDMIKQEIENKLFNDQLSKELEKSGGVQTVWQS